MPGESEKTESRENEVLTWEITGGASRVLVSLGNSVLTEFTLGNGRRADIAGINRQGRITIVEVKSSLSDFRSDGKWPEYLDYCDLFYFAVGPGFPLRVLDEEASFPEKTGIIVADRFDGDVLRPAPYRKMAPARRRSETLRFARSAADRLGLSSDSLALTTPRRRA
ncbi:MAG: MmcB family DNA repair protein [Sphingomonadales bacterium]